MEKSTFYREGMVGVSLTGDIRMRSFVSQGARRVGPTFNADKVGTCAACRSVRLVAPHFDNFFSSWAMGDLFAPVVRRPLSFPLPTAVIRRHLVVVVFCHFSISPASGVVDIRQPGPRKYADSCCFFVVVFKRSLFIVNRWMGQL